MGKKKTKPFRLSVFVEGVAKMLRSKAGEKERSFKKGCSSSSSAKIEQIAKLLRGHTHSPEEKDSK